MSSTRNDSLSMEEHEATFSALLMSIASSCLIFMGLAPHEDGSLTRDKNMARFNIDLLLMIKEKTKGNLTHEEETFLQNLLADLQKKFLSL